ncbi:tripartite motif-containing protein 16-like protein [Trichomycterus rosablanca]|uniref:tripartite motif-containing protein 16-like protein n=1 Tax=Trichomycterus rosablanca TaxID=2290929 RepID=UPI002F356CB6
MTSWQRSTVIRTKAGFVICAEVQECNGTFKELICSTEKISSEAKKLIEDQEKAEVKKAELLLEQLEQENSDLEKSVSNMEQLLQIQDHIHFVESFKSLNNSFIFEDSPNITINERFSFDELKKSFSELKNQIEEFCKETFNNMPTHVAAFEIISPSEPKSKDDLLKYLSYLTLDSNTAHYNLHLSEKNRTVRGSQIHQPYSKHSERFEDWLQVLCKERVRGRCYWEVQWIGDVFISVSYKGISRKGCGSDCVFGLNHYSWSLELKSSSIFFWHNSRRIELQVPSPTKIGVYVDQRSGILSFYSVSNKMKLLHSIQTTFSQPLYAGFRLHFNSTVKLCDPK